MRQDEHLDKMRKDVYAGWASQGSGLGYSSGFMNTGSPWLGLYGKRISWGEPVFVTKIQRSTQV